MYFRLGLMLFLLLAAQELCRAQNKHNLTDTSSFYIVDTIRLEGNRLTHPSVIRRELPFKDGDTLPGNQLWQLCKQSHDNLMNTALFNFVDIDTLLNKESHISVVIRMKERWYIWPFPIFEISDRNFNSWLEKGDLSRINYGLYLVIDNFRGRKESLKFLLRFGFDQKYSFSYTKPNLDRRHRLGIGFTTGYGRNHTTSYLSQDNKQLFFRSENRYTVQNFYQGVQLTYRKGLYMKHTMNLYFDNYRFVDSIYLLNNSFCGIRDPMFFTLYYKFEWDRRDYITYPLNGFYLNVEAEKKGLGLIRGKEIDLLSLKASYRHYWNLDTRWFFAAGIFTKFSHSGIPAYFAEQGLGFGSETIRSMEYYVIDGQHYGMVKTQLKYQLLKTKIINLKFLPLSKFNRIPVAFYLNLYYDGAYVSENRQDMMTTLNNNYIYGGGIGLDFVTYYDQVIRLEYSMNMMREHGFFLHFTAPF